MNSMGFFFLMACMIAAASASSNQNRMKSARASNSLNSNTQPTNWISSSELLNMPSLEEVDVNKLLDMGLEEGAELIDTMWHLSNIRRDNSLVLLNPSAKEISVYLMKPNGKYITTTLDKLPEAAADEPNFGDVETNVIITGLPQNTDTVKGATKKLIQAFMERCNAELMQLKRRVITQNRQSKYNDNSYNDYSDDLEKETERIPTCDVVVVDVGDYCKDKSIGCTLRLDSEKIGQTVGRVLARVSEKVNVPSEIISLQGQQIGAHIAGAAARAFRRQTGQKIRRITALDPSKLFFTDRKQICGLLKSDADFVDAIHTSAHGLGTTAPVGDVDFYPNGPNEGVPGAKNVIDASMRATQYFAESVRPGNENNFPALPANAIGQLKDDENKKRGHMGYKAEYDLSGIYMLKVNNKSPFGKNTL